MAFRLKDGSIYLHLPRTGGTFLTSVLRKIGLIEGPVGLKHDCPGVVPFDMKVRHFVFVREPYALLKSTYSWLKGYRWGPWPKQKGDGRWWHPWHEITSGVPESVGGFDSWLQWITEERTGYVTRLYSKFADWPCTYFVGTTEHLERDVMKILRLLGVRDDAAKKAMLDAKVHRNPSPVRIDDAKESTIEEFIKSEGGAVALWQKAYR